MRPTHISRKPALEGRGYPWGAVLATVAGNRVTLTRLNDRGMPVVISDETIPDECLPIIMEGLCPIDSPEGKELLRATATMVGV